MIYIIYAIQYQSEHNQITNTNNQIQSNNSDINDIRVASIQLREFSQYSNDDMTTTTLKLKRHLLITVSR